MLSRSLLAEHAATQTDKGVVVWSAPAGERVLGETVIGNVHMTVPAEPTYVTQSAPHSITTHHVSVECTEISMATLEGGSGLFN